MEKDCSNTITLPQPPSELQVAKDLSDTCHSPPSPHPPSGPLTRACCCIGCAEGSLSSASSIAVHSPSADGSASTIMSGGSTCMPHSAEGAAPSCLGEGPACTRVQRGAARIAPGYTLEQGPHKSTGRAAVHRAMTKADGGASQRIPGKPPTQHSPPVRPPLLSRPPSGRRQRLPRWRCRRPQSVTR